MKVDKDVLAAAIAACVMRNRKHTKDALLRYFTSRLNDPHTCRMAMQIQEIHQQIARSERRKRSNG
jgi:hypothetical protein